MFSSLLSALVCFRLADRLLATTGDQWIGPERVGFRHRDLGGL